MGKTVTHVGDSGAGQVAKAANQIMVAAQMAAMGELLIFARKAGVSPQKVVEAIKAGAAQCWTLDVKPPRLFAGNRNPGFKAYMQLKDMKIVMETAREYGIPLPSATENTQALPADDRHGHGRARQFRRRGRDRAPGQRTTCWTEAEIALVRQTLLQWRRRLRRRSEQKMNASHRFWPDALDYGLLFVGGTLQAIGLRLFLVPAELASGGVSGISQLINHYTHWPIGLHDPDRQRPAVRPRLALPRRTALRASHGRGSAGLFDDDRLDSPLSHASAQRHHQTISS